MATYATVAELRSRLEIPFTDASADAELDAALNDASREIDGHAQRRFDQITETRTFTPTRRDLVIFGAFNDLVAATAISTDSDGDGVYELTWAASDYQLLTESGSPNPNAGPQLMPYQQLRATGAYPLPAHGMWLRRNDLLRITGIWGWPAVPAPVRQACLVIAAEVYKLRSAPFGVVGVADLGIVRVRQNAMADRLLAPYRLNSVLIA